MKKKIVTVAGVAAMLITIISCAGCGSSSTTAAQPTGSQATGTVQGTAK